MNMLGYAVIGTGWITQSFIDGARLDGGMKPEGVYSRSAERGAAFALQNGIQTVYTDLDALARSDIPAVYIASPNSCHARHTETMLKAGKSVICEKPITVTPRELDYLQGLAEKNNAVYVEAIMHMFNPVREALRAAMGKIGRITSAQLDFSQLSSKYPAYKSGALPNIFNPKMATGCLEDLGIYCVYPALDYFGVPKKISGSSYFMESGADGCGNATFEYDNAHVTLTYSKLGQSRAGSQIFGDEGTIVIGSLSQLTDIKTVFNDGSEETLIGEVEKPVLMGYEATGFRRIIENRAENAAFYDELRDMAMKTSLAMERIRKSAGIGFDYSELVKGR